MKQFIFGVILLMTITLSTAWAQSTYNAPWPGATHTYSVTISDPTEMNIVRWYVATSADGTRATYNTVYSFVTSGYNAANDQLEGTGVYEVQIAWGSNVPLDADYYVFFEMEKDGCTNKMALPVHTIDTGFNAIAYNVSNVSDPANYGTDTSGPPGSNLESCPSDPVDPIWNGTGHTDIGSTELVFRVERTNSNNKWNLSYAITETGGLPFDVEEVRVLAQNNKTELARFAAKTGVTATDIINAGQDFVLVYVKITNQQGVDLNLRFSIAGSEDVGTSPATTDSDSGGDNIVLHTVKQMPTISGFGGS